MTSTPRPATSAGLVLPDPITRTAASSSRIGYALDAARMRPAGRRTLALFAVVMGLAAAGMFAFPLFTDLYATQLVQRPLADQFESPQLVERYRTRTIESGDPLTRIVMPALGIDSIVVEGTSAAALRAGAGHYPSTPLPGEAGNVAIAGHRTSYGRPFNRLDELGVGEEIQLVTPLATHSYRVMAAPAEVGAPCASGACWVTGPADWPVVGPQPAPGSLLTLTTCHPKGTAQDRLILRAELVSSAPRDPAAAMAAPPGRDSAPS